MYAPFTLRKETSPVCFKSIAITSDLNLCVTLYMYMLCPYIYIVYTCVIAHLNRPFLLSTFSTLLLSILFLSFLQFPAIQLGYHFPVTLKRPIGPWPFCIPSAVAVQQRPPDTLVRQAWLLGCIHVHCQSRATPLLCATDWGKVTNRWANPSCWHTVLSNVCQQVPHSAHDPRCERTVIIYLLCTMFDCIFGLLYIFELFLDFWED